uniref:Ell-associated factor Eaf n=1 Tax=Aceria tosichella TaxID=561515 RepID=A0A6G1SH62_9ACAR
MTHHCFTNKEFQLKRSQDRHQYHTLRYDFKPASVNSDESAALELTQNGQVTIKAPNVGGSSAKYTVFKGQRRPHVKECLLVIDNRTGEMVLQKLSDNITVKATRAIGGGSGNGNVNSNGNSNSNSSSNSNSNGNGTSNGNGIGGIVSGTGGGGITTTNPILMKANRALASSGPPVSGASGPTNFTNNNNNIINQNGHQLSEESSSSSNDDDYSSDSSSSSSSSSDPSSDEGFTF